MNTHARAAAARSATYWDVLDAPEHMVAEIASGRLHLNFATLALPLAAVWPD